MGGKWKPEADCSAWPSLSLKNTSPKVLWLNAVDCSAEYHVLPGPLFSCVDTQPLAGVCPGVFA